jgi:hypothetical protein
MKIKTKKNGNKTLYGPADLQVLEINGFKLKALRKKFHIDKMKSRKNGAC